MNTSTGYLKKTLTNDRVLLAGGGDKELSELGSNIEGKINLTDIAAIQTAQESLTNDGSYKIYLITDNEGNLPSSKPAVAIPSNCVKRLSATIVGSNLSSLIPDSLFSSLGANVGDLIFIARISTTVGELKNKYGSIIPGDDSSLLSIYSYKIIATNDAKATGFNSNGYIVADGVMGLESPWDKTLINKIPGIETAVNSKLTVYTNSINAGNGDDVWPLGLYTNVTRGRTNGAVGNWIMFNTGGWNDNALLAIDKGDGALYSRIVSGAWGRVLRNQDNLGGLDLGYTVYLNSPGSSNFAHPLSIRNSNTTDGLATIFSIGGPDDYLGVAYLGFVYKGLSSLNNFATIGLYNQDYIINATAAGNVGIGTTTPAYKLHVDGDIALGEKLYIADMNGVPRLALDYESEELWLGWGTTSLKLSTTHIIGNGITIHVPTSDATVNDFGDDEAVLILPNGNVGIGITPLNKLHVNGDIAALGFLKTTNNGNTMLIGSYNSACGYFVNSANVPFHFNRNVLVQGELYAGSSYNQKVWHEGNDGAGSGLDADLLDGKHGDFYCREWTAHAGGPTYTGWIRFAKIQLNNNNLVHRINAIISMCRAYTSPASESYLLSVIFGWQKCNIQLLNSSVSTLIVQKFRTVLDSNAHIVYFEYYVNPSYNVHANDLNFKMWSYEDGYLIVTMESVANTTTTTYKEINLTPDITLIHSGNVTNYITNGIPAIYPDSSTSYVIDPNKEYFLANITSNTIITLSLPVNATTEVNEYKFNFVLSYNNITITINTYNNRTIYWENPFSNLAGSRRYEVSIQYDNRHNYYNGIYSVWT